MSEIISKTIRIKTENLPPKADYIEKEIEKQGLEALRWAITDVKNNTLTVSVSGRKKETHRAK